ncbi:uncharacterized protein LOC119104643 [Pollicipes pollicipes]|uniref:uncharacterized protein LOC119104643 n=1 Tax=Pollicipes pollicipes TaxID=41117 RepID=UPI001885468D|nr:uncharacterized protein LOC119104643 [Pollicipes pollicipes]
MGAAYKMDRWLVTALLVIVCLQPGATIRCYQCSTSEDGEGEDNCGAYSGFDDTRNVAIECNSEEANTPGTFCAKIVTQGPIGFIWDGRWRQVIRRCAADTKAGVNNVCNWKVQMNGEYIEECYCSKDNCNSAPGLGAVSPLLLLAAPLLALLASA